MTMFRINWSFHYFYMMFFAVAAGLFLWLAYKRRRDFLLTATCLGLAFEAKAGAEVGAVLKRFSLFPDPSPDHVGQWVHGTYQNMQVMAFNYCFREGPTFAEMSLLQCLAFRLPHCLPSLRMKASPAEPDVLAQNRIFWDDVAFTDLYTVKGQHSDFAHALFDDEIIAHLITRPDYAVFIEDDWLLFARTGELEAPQLEAFLAEGFPLAQRASSYKLEGAGFKFKRGQRG